MTMTLDDFSVLLCYSNLDVREKMACLNLLREAKFSEWQPFTFFKCHLIFVRDTLNIHYSARLNNKMFGLSNIWFARV